MSAGAFLAVDWGTTHLRCWVVDARGRPGPRLDLPLGVSRLAPGEAAARFRDEVRPAAGAQGLPAVMAGMIGSTLGWREAPYLDCPADLGALAGALTRIADEDPPVLIAPGLRCLRPDMDAPDVMRGEEVQAMGWVAADPRRARGRHLVCHPGTHAKWIEVVDGRVTRFVTTMTGELFDLLSSHGVLRSDPAPPGADDDAAFDLGAAAAGEGEALASKLFTVRSRVVGGDLPRAAARPYLSGLLIGADVAGAAALMGFPPGAEVALVGAPALTARYARVLAARGARTTETDGDEAVLAGLAALHAAAGARAP